MLARTARGQRELAMEHARLFAHPFAELIDSNAATEQKEQGEGFDIPFYPGNSTVFDPTKSSTFSVVPHQVTSGLTASEEAVTALHLTILGVLSAGLHAGVCRQHALERVSGQRCCAARGLLRESKFRRGDQLR